MTEKVKKFKLRRMNRLLRRMDADDSEGHWVTTENNHHIHINENGVPDKGNPYVVAAMTGKKPRVGLSDKQRKIASLLDKEDSGSEIRSELKELPEGSIFVIRKKREMWGGRIAADITAYKKTANGDYVDMKSGATFDSYQVVWELEHSADHEFDLYDPDQGVEKKMPRTQRDFQKLTSWSGFDEREEKTREFLSKSPEKARMKFPGDDGPFIRKKEKDSYVWVNRKSGEKLNDSEMFERLKDKNFGIYPGYSAGIQYSEPKVEHTSGSFAEGHKIFDDTAAGTHEYRGVGKKTVQFFSEKSNCNELIQNMDLSETRAFKSWTEGWFMDGQQYKGFSNMDSTSQKYTRSMDNILDKARLDEPIVVSRLSNASLVLGKGYKVPLLSELKAMKGKKIVSKGAMSCAAASEGLTIGSREKLVEYKISVPSGEGYGMWVGDSRINSWGAEQREFVLNRDVQYEVGDTVYNSERGIFEVELKLVRRLEHDYGD